MSSEATEQWQRLAPLALVFLIVNGLQKFIRENLYAFAGAGAGFAFIDWLGLRELLFAAVAVLLIATLTGLVYHRRFRFRLEDDAIRLRRGILEHKELRVRFARIQNVELSSPFYLRPFGLVRFSLQTPGAAEKEVELPGISGVLAAQMRDRIAARVDGSESAEAAPGWEHAGSEWMLKKDSLALFRHGLTSNQIWVIAGAAAPFLGVASQRLVDWLSDLAAWQWLAEQIQSGLVLASLLVAGLALTLLLSSGLLAIVRFHGYRLTERDDRLVAVAGLFDRREQTIRPVKITGVMWRQTALGRLLGCWYLVARQASSIGFEMDGDKSSFTIPGLDAEEREVAGRLMAGAEKAPELLPISLRFRRFFWLRLFVLLALVLLAAVMLLGRDHWAVWLIALAMPPMLVLIHLRWRHWGYAIVGQIMWVRQGLLGQRIDAFPLALVQQLSVTESPYLRRHKLASLHLLLPHGEISVPFLDRDVADQLANQALHAAETTRHHRI